MASSLVFRLVGTPHSSYFVLPSLSRMQARLVFIQQLNPDKPLYQIPTAFRVRGALDEEILGGSLRRMADRHHMLRASIRFEGDGPRQVVAPGDSPVALSVARAGLS